jgi:hypothetical protein
MSWIDSLSRSLRPTNKLVIRTNGYLTAPAPLCFFLFFSTTFFPPQPTTTSDSSTPVKKFIDPLLINNY